MLHGVDGSFNSVAAFVLGFDAATNGGLLSGFREWLIVRINDGNNLAWPALAGRLLAVDCPHGDPGRVCADCGDQGGFELLGVLDEFLAIKEERNGLAKIFDAYLEWLKKQQWYRSDMLE
ncbi:hypothetical protein AB0C50_22010 [Micromonospora taraxaci]|uniref:hypothetical protein n=1 Tax=Micromonospora taraxaci TaxID=1316803 RepID=UPI0033E3DA99